MSRWPGRAGSPGRLLCCKRLVAFESTTDRWTEVDCVRSIEGPWNQGIFAVNTMLNTLAILFAEAKVAALPRVALPRRGGSLLTSMLPMIVVFAAFWYFILYLPMKRERARQAALLAAIKKNDRVLTTSGIYGVVTNVSKESNEVTLRIDETTNAKLRVTLNSVAQVLGDEPSADTPSK